MSAPDIYLFSLNEPREEIRNSPEYTTYINAVAQLEQLKLRLRYAPRYKENNEREILRILTLPKTEIDYDKYKTELQNIRTARSKLIKDLTESINTLVDKIVNTDYIKRWYTDENIENESKKWTIKQSFNF